MTDTTSTGPSPARTERDDIADLLDEQRGLFLVTVRGLSDEQVRLTPTASTLSLGGLIKHVADTITGWLDFVDGRPEGGDASAEEGGGEGGDQGAGDWGSASEESIAAFMAGFQLQADETLAGALETYETVHARTLEAIRSVDLDASHPLPPAPWFEPGASWSNRKVFVHILRETAQHAGHADIIRESIDGQKTMG